MDMAAPTPAAQCRSGAIDGASDNPLAPVWLVSWPTVTSTINALYCVNLFHFGGQRAESKAHAVLESVMPAALSRML